MSHNLSAITLAPHGYMSELYHAGRPELITAERCCKIHQKTSIILKKEPGHGIINLTVQGRARFLPRRQAPAKVYLWHLAQSGRTLRLRGVRRADPRAAGPLPG